MASCRPTHRVLPAPLLLAPSLLALLVGCLDDADVVVGRYRQPVACGPDGGGGADGGACLAQPGPRPVLVPAELELGDVPLEGVRAATLTLTNAGDLELRVLGMLVADDAQGQLGAEVAGELGTVRQLPAVLRPAAAGEPGAGDGGGPDTLVLRVVLRPTQIGDVRGELRLTTDDPDHPALVVPVRGRVTGACLGLLPDGESFGTPPPQDADFGEVTVGTAVDRWLRLVNCGNLPLHVDQLAFVKPDQPSDFRIQSAPAGLTCDARGRSCDGALLLGEQEVQRLRVRYAPAAEEADFDSLVAHSSAPRPLTSKLSLLGVSSRNRCPVAAIQASLLGEGGWAPGVAASGQPLVTVPRTWLRLDGSGSRDPDGTVAGFRWLISEAPPFAAARFSPDDTTPVVNLLLDAAGRYAFTLQVLDDQGRPSCDDARLEVEARPAAGLYVELLWTTARDADPADEGPGAGADLDLHLRHERGAWFESPLDCYYANPAPDWGRQLQPADDPQLVADDTDGWGPEVIRLAAPERTASYALAVHSYNDWSYGPSTASVRIFLDGQLGDQLQHLLNPHAFWEVATVMWTDGTITEMNRVSDSAPGGGGPK